MHSRRGVVSESRREDEGRKAREEGRRRRRGDKDSRFLPSLRVPSQLGSLGGTVERRARKKERKVSS